MEGENSVCRDLGTEESSSYWRTMSIEFSDINFLKSAQGTLGVF